MSMTYNDQVSNQSASGQEEMMMPGLSFRKKAQTSTQLPEGQTGMGTSWETREQIKQLESWLSLYYHRTHPGNRC